jgi:hypothetical protein
MAGMPLRKARAMVAAARAERQRLVADGALSAEEAAEANARDDEYVRQVASGATGDTERPATPPALPQGELEPWLIADPKELQGEYERRGANGHVLKDDPARIERLLFLVRAGVPIKDSREGPGAARQCGLHPATVWDWVHTNPEFAARYREARDASSEILEDEMRAMLPTAMRHPELVRSLEFVAGRLEWLARVRNKDRYGDEKAKSGPQGVTFNINMTRPAAESPAIDVTPERARLPGVRIQQPATVSPREAIDVTAESAAD